MLIEERSRRKENDLGKLVVSRRKEETPKEGEMIQGLLGARKIIFKIIVSWPYERKQQIVHRQTAQRASQRRADRGYKPRHQRARTD